MSERPLPPNRRVAQPKPSKQVVQAPDESAGLPESRPARRVDKGRVIEVLRTVSAIVVAIVTSVACVWGLVHYTHNSPRFGIRHIHVTGAVHRTSEDIARLGGIRSEDNIFALDLDGAQRRILEDAWIERVTITRRLPSTIRIDVVEREPAALVSMSGALFLATREGEIFKRVEPGDPLDFPIVTGIDPSKVATDRAGIVTSIRRGLDVAGEYERIGQSKRFPVQEIHVPGDGTLSLVVGKEGLVLRMGKGPYRKALEQASRVLGEVVARRAQASVIFLDNEAHPERVVVRMK